MFRKTAFGLIALAVGTVAMVAVPTISEARGGHRGDGFHGGGGFRGFSGGGGFRSFGGGYRSFGGGYRAASFAPQIYRSVPVYRSAPVVYTAPYVNRRVIRTFYSAGSYYAGGYGYRRSYPVAYHGGYGSYCP